MNRTLNRVVLKSTGGAPAWDAGLSVVLKTDEGTPATVATAAEVASGHYRANFTSVEKWGFWYVGGTKMSDWGQVWLGAEPSAPAANSVVAVNAAGTERTTVTLTASRFVVTDVSGTLSTSSVLGVSSDAGSEYISMSAVGSLKSMSLQLAAYTNKYATIQFFAGAPGASTLRWQVGKESNAESGSNVGSDFLLVSYNDTGGTIGTAFRIRRSSLLAEFGGAVVSSSYLQGTYLELSSEAYLRASIYARNKANSAWVAVLARSTSQTEVRFALNYVSQAVINNYVVGGAEQTVLRLGNYTDSLTSQYDIITEDVGEQALILHSTRWTGGLSVRRSGSAGTMRLAKIWGTESQSAYMELYSKGPSTQTVHSKFDFGTWTSSPSSGAAQVVLKVATYSTSGVAVQCDSVNGSLVLNTLDARAIVFKVQDSQKAQFDSNGKFQFGTATATHDWTFEDGKTVGSKTFQTGIFGGGFKLDQGATLTSQSRLEIDNILVRGSMRVHIFQKDIVRATNGYLFITDSTTATGATVVDGSTPFSLPIKEAVFQADDLLWIKDLDESGGGLTVLSVFLAVVNVSTPLSPVVEYVSGDYPATLKAGMTIVRIGNASNTARQGSIFFDASGTNPPYMDVYDGRDSVSAVAPKVRLGKLTGISDSAFGGTLAGYGLYTQNGYFKGNIVVASTTSISLAASTISIGNVTGTANYGIKLANTGTAATSGLFGYDGSAAELFALRMNGTAQIAGWSFTTSQLSKDADANNGVRLESGASFAGLAVKTGGADLVKVGSFTNATETYSTTSISSGLGAWAEDYDQLGTFSVSSGGVITSSTQSPPGNGFAFKASKSLPVSGGNDVRGRTLKLTFTVEAREDASGDGTDLPYSCVGIVEINGTTNLAFIAATPPDVDVYPDYGTLVTRTLTVRIPSTATSAKFIFGSYWTNSTPCDLRVTVTVAEIYTVPKIEINASGLKAYSSPVDRIVLNPTSESDLAVATARVGESLVVGNWKVYEERGLTGAYVPYSKLWFAYSTDGGATFANVWRIDNNGATGTT